MPQIRRQLAETFRGRLAELVESHPGGQARFARETGLDRSALSQFLDPESLRLPRAETLRAIALARGTSADWLLGLTAVRGGGQQVASSVEIETAHDPEGGSPLARWRKEAEGGKIRYVPSSLPDMFRLPEVFDPGVDPGRAEARASHADALVEDARFRDTDIEICMGAQALEAICRGEGLWAGVPAETRRAQLSQIAREAERLYPSIRLHLYDAGRTFSAPLTVFALKRAAIYLGRSYLVVTATDQVRGLARHFDDLVREAVVPPNTVHDWVTERAAAVGR